MTEQEYYEKLHLAEELYHHGIEGQKWGEQNGPPYPLNAAGRKRLNKQILKMKADEYDNHLKENLKNKNKNEATKYLRNESREMETAYFKRNRDRGEKVTLATMAGVLGGYGMGVVGAMTGNAPLLVAGIMTEIGGIVVPSTTLFFKSRSDQNKMMDRRNVLSRYYDKYNITDETERRLNV